MNKLYNGKNVLITGHTGFKGSWLSLWLHRLGAQVTGFALEPYSKKDNFVRAGMSDHIRDIRGDIRDYDFLLALFKEHSPEIVFHLAAQPLVREGYLTPKETFDINVGGTVNLLECCRHSDSVKTIIVVTSDKCYENREQIRGYREDDPMGGYDPYSASKGCAELVVSSYRRSFFPPERYEVHGKALSSVRAGNVIGGGDWAKDRLLPDCIRSLSRLDDILIRNPHATRPWQFVLEPLGGYLRLAEKMEQDPVRYASAWNFGPDLDSVVPVGRIADLVLETWGSGRWYTETDQNAPHEACNLSLDITKARRELQWYPRYDVKKAVEQTVAWYKANMAGEDMLDFCTHQIDAFINVEQGEE